MPAEALGPRRCSLGRLRSRWTKHTAWRRRDTVGRGPHSRSRSPALSVSPPPPLGSRQRLHHPSYVRAAASGPFLSGECCGVSMLARLPGLWRAPPAAPALESRQGGQTVLRAALQVRVVTFGLKPSVRTCSGNTCLVDMAGAQRWHHNAPPRIWLLRKSRGIKR